MLQGESIDGSFGYQKEEQCGYQTEYGSGDQGRLRRGSRNSHWETIVIVEKPRKGMAFIWKDTYAEIRWALHSS